MNTRFIKTTDNKIEIKLRKHIVLNRIELYASACYDNTQLHLSNIEKMEILDEIKNYDYKIRYPEKLKFNYE